MGEKASEEASEAANRLVEFFGCSGNVLPQKILSRYLPLQIFRDCQSRMVVQAKDKQNDAIVVLKLFQIANEPGYLLDLILPCRLPLPVPLNNFHSKGFAVIVFPFLEHAVHCHPRTSRMWLEVLQQLFKALNALHLGNWAHLDVKPSNVLVREKGSNFKFF